MQQPDVGVPSDLSVLDFSMQVIDINGPCPGPCAGDTPFCDEKAHRCVGCLRDGDCPDEMVCKRGTCASGCSASHAACGDAGSCDVDLGVCRGCIADRECSDPMRPLCDRPSGRCVPCLMGNDTCPLGFYCDVGGGIPVCLAGCKTDLECLAFGDAGVHTACCNHACIDLFNSLPNCGGCGKVCNLGACCAGQCADPRNDVANCGSCGKVCPALNNIPQCANGVCTNRGCVVGFADCDGNPQNGCEISLSSDARNCGNCGMACMLPNATAACFGGLCTIQSCSAGYRNCDGMTDNGCEVNTGADVQNCGGCGNQCSNAVSHGQPGCAAGACIVKSCDMGYGDCDTFGGNGCESVLATDPLNCGGCGNKCPVPAHMLGTCANSVCGIGDCQVGYGDCDKDLNDGCEVNLGNDAKNCNACGIACALGQICKGAKCVAGDFGGGGDGPLTVVANNTTTINAVRATAAGAAGQATLSVNSTVGFRVGDNVVIHQTQGNGAGQWEFSAVAAVGNGTLTLGGSLVNTYSSSNGSHAQVVVVPQYTDVTVNGTLTAGAWDGNTGGILAIQVLGTLSVSGAISMNGKGYRGASHACTYQCHDGTAGESPKGAGALGVGANGSGGGGGGQGQDCAEGAGGGHGTAGQAGPMGTGGTCSNPGHPGGTAGATVGQPDLTQGIFFGGAGGEGGADEDGAFPGSGGNGGGIIIIQAQTVKVSGAMSSAGARGGDGDNASCGSAGCGMSGGGGGAGGAIRIVSADVALGNGLVTAAGAAGGICTCDGVGGTGGNGRIAVKSPMITGTTTPVYFGG